VTSPDAVFEQIARLIRRSGVFPGTDDAFVQSLARAARWFSLPGGAQLFGRGDLSDAMYIVIAGRLGAYVDDGAGERTVGVIGPGELVGEMGCITGETRSATVRALRATDVIAISERALARFASDNPLILQALARTVIGRLRRAQEEKHASLPPRTFCVLPHGIGSETAQIFAADLATALGALGRTYLATQANAGAKTAGSLSEIESENEFVVYCADAHATAWSALCLRQSDTVLAVARPGDTPQPLDPAVTVNPGTAVDLLLLWSGDIVPGKTAAWLDALSPRRHFHVRARPDIERAARLLTGRGLGLVLSGGGARGIAHIGVIRALAERGVAVDAICGASMGALVGGLMALEWDVERMRNGASTFGHRHPLRDLNFPRVSLLSDRNPRTAFGTWFEDWSIEDAPIPYACVTANLNAGAAAVHTRGQFKTWVRASTALPGIFPPVVEDGVAHIDGGVVNNLPADIIRDLGAGCVVGVDVGSAALPNTSPGIIEIMMRASTMNSDVQALTMREQCDVLLIPDVQHLSLMNWRAYDAAIELGYRCAQEKIGEIEQRVRGARAPGTMPSAEPQGDTHRTY
jgi:NTE family protein